MKNLIFFIVCCQKFKNSVFYNDEILLSNGIITNPPNYKLKMYWRAWAAGVSCIHVYCAPPDFLILLRKAPSATPTPRF